MILLLPDVAIARNFDLAPFRKKVDDRHAHAVQAARRLVGALLKLATKLKHRHHAFERGNFAVHLLGKLGVPLDGNAAAVVFHRDAAVSVDNHAHTLGIVGHAFID